MRILKTVIPLLFLMTVSTFVSGQSKAHSKWLKKVARAEDKFEEGKYSAAYRSAKRLVKKAEKGKKYTVEISSSQVLMAKYAEARGRALEAQSILDSISFTAFDTLSPLHKTAFYYYSALTYQLIGNQAKALENIAKGREIAAGTNDSIQEWKLQFDQIEILSLFAQMNYTAADAKLSTLHSTLLKKAQRYQNGKKIKRSQWKEAQAKLAQNIVQLAELELLRGNLPVAEMLYSSNDDTLKTLIKKNSLTYFQHIAGMAKLKADQLDYKGAAKAYHKALRRFQRKVRYQFPNRLYFELLEQEMYTNLQLGKLNKYQKLSKLHKYKTKSFGRHSTYFLSSKSMMIEDELVIHRYRKALRKAEKLYNKLDDYYPKNHLNRTQLLYQLYEIAVHTNDFQQARDIHDSIQVLYAFNYGVETPVFHKLKLEQGIFELNYPNQFKRADSIFSTHFDGYISQIHNFHNDYIPTTNSYAKIFTTTDRFNAAYELLENNTEIAKTRFGNESEAYGLQLQKLAEIHIILGNYPIAEELLEKAANVIKADVGKRGQTYANVLYTLGELYNINGQYDDARQMLKKAYRINHKLGSIGEMQSVNSTEELAELYIKTGRYDDAENLLEKSIEIKEHKYGETHFQLINPYYTLGELFLIRGDFVKAEKATRKALDIAEISLSDTSIKFINTQILLGDVYASMGDFDQAKSIYTTSIAHLSAKFSNRHLSIADLQLKIAEQQMMNNNTEGIDTLLQDAEEIILFNLNKEHPKYGDVLRLKAQLATTQLNYTKALELLNASTTIYRQALGENHVSTVDNLIYTGNVYYVQTDYKNAIDFYKKAAKGYKKIFSKEHPNYVNAESSIGRTYFVMGNHKQALKTLTASTTAYLEFIDNFFPSLSEREKSDYWNFIRSDFELMNVLALEYGNKKETLYTSVYNNKLATKAILLNSSLKIRKRILSSGDNELIALYETWGAKKEQLAKTLSMSATELKATGISVSKLERDINLLEKQLSERSLGFSEEKKSKKVTFKDIRKQLKDNEAAIEIIRFNNFEKDFTDSVIYAALIVTPKTKKHPIFLPLNSGNELEAKFYKYYRNTIKYKATDRYSYGKFWQPIDSVLVTTGSSVIYLSVDGVYNQLNPETFADTNGKYMLDKYSIVSLSNTKDILLAKNESTEMVPSQSAVLFGNPSFIASDENDGKDLSTSSSTINRSVNGEKVSSVEPLPGAEKEVNIVSELLRQSNWKTQKFIATNATEMEVKDLESPRVFHVATHGFFMNASQSELSLRPQTTTNPLHKSGLLFAGADELMREENVYQFNKKDGVLTAFEAMNLKLDHTELVVLSACETGLGEVKVGEGVYGLQRAFLVAGAQNVIMTLFKVNDQVTQELMTEFYSKWLEHGDKRKAFLQAKQMIKEKYDAPIYWGAFVMIGK